MSNGERRPATLLTGVAVFVALAALAGLLLHTVQTATAERRAFNQARHEARLLAEALPVPGAVAGAQVLQLQDAELLGSSTPLPAYPAYGEDGEAVAVALTVIAPDGYVGPVRLLVGIAADGKILAVRATNHRETPGLGDRIDSARSDWIKTFNGRAAGDHAGLLLTRDGGSIDHISGATVTSRAVTAAVSNALDYFTRHRDTLLAPRAD